MAHCLWMQGAVREGRGTEFKWTQSFHLPMSLGTTWRRHTSIIFDDVLHLCGNLTFKVLPHPRLPLILSEHKEPRLCLRQMRLPPLGPERLEEQLKVTERKQMQSGCTPSAPGRKWDGAEGLFREAVGPCESSGDLHAEDQTLILAWRRVAG